MLNWIWILNNLSSKLLTIWTVKLLWISIILNCQLFQKLYSAIIRLFIYGIQLVAFSLNHSPQTHRWLFKIGVVMRGKVFIMNIKRAKKKKKRTICKKNNNNNNIWMKFYVMYQRFCPKRKEESIEFSWSKNVLTNLVRKRPNML